MKIEGICVTVNVHRLHNAYQCKVVNYYFG